MAQNDWTTDPAEIPEDGERYDMTLDRVGLANIGPKDNQRKVIVVKAIIDKGEYEGKKVSNIFDYADPLEEEKFFNFEKVIGQRADGTATALKDFIRPFKRVEKDARFSAVVHTEEFEDESKRGIRYGLDEFDEPQHEEPDLHLRSEPTQFKRNV